MNLESLIRKQDWVYGDAGTYWQDGLILGNGNLGIVAYAPHHLEWTINKVDVFDGRVPDVKLTPHKQVMKYFTEQKQSTVTFLNEWEKPPKNSPEVLTMTAATLRLYFGNAVGWSAPVPHRVKQTLCLWEGELYSQLDAHLSHPRIRSFTPRGTNLFCVRMEGCSIQDWNHVIELYRPQNVNLKAPEFRGGKGEMVFTQQMPHGASYSVAVLAVPLKKTLKPPFPLPFCADYSACEPYIREATLEDFRSKFNQGGNMDLFVAVRTSCDSRNTEKAALQEVRQAAGKGFTALERENRKWWKSFWNKGWVDFGKHETLQKYWTFSLYESACAFGKAPMPGLNGLWYGASEGVSPGVGTPGYIHDQNVQIPLMPFFPLNRAEFVTPFADTYLQAMPELLKNTRRLFNRKGICLPLAMSQLGREIPVAAYRYSLCGSAYSGIILCMAWRYSGDKNLLRNKIYPLLREFVRFYVNGMELGEDGRYHLDWEIPPEIYTMTRDATATLGMLKTCLVTAIEASKILKCDVRESELWKRIVTNYPQLALHSDGGWWGGPDIPDDHYCHGAHLLYPFFPGESFIDEEGSEIAAHTVEFIEKYSVDRSFAGADGLWFHRHDWSWFLTNVTKMRLGSERKAFNSLEEFLRLFGKPNGLFSHNPVVELDPAVTEASLKHLPHVKIRKYSGDTEELALWLMDGKCSTPNRNAKHLVSPVLEGNAAFLFAATEALLQSFGGLIRLFPCVPPDFTGGFHKLRTHGAFEVSAEMLDGKVILSRQIKTGSIWQLKLPRKY